ncbi:hypothetical protein T10_843 [Trichinella papuae]|uniref:Uncharacterized protein n=1 Tax=Trichinella papuae TaxID=268474 RepID=A0A0V1LWG4_9BILA|nr:hypothetical protein T10_843 [Trichinella papuae]
MPPLLKCKHPGSVLREFQRGRFPCIAIYRNITKKAKISKKKFSPKMRKQQSL